MASFVGGRRAERENGNETRALTTAPKRAWKLRSCRRARSLAVVQCEATEIDMELFDKTFNAIERKLDLHLKRHTVLSSNLANSETPHFTAREIDFAGELKKALGQHEEPLVKTNPQHMDISSSEGAHIVLDQSMPVGADGNNVDLDITTARISSNGRAYTGAAELLSMKLRMLRMAARGRGGF
ncbi:MAG: flagellar basal body rod protein FlgB [Bdellovibrionales bacterium]|nr:flagellar basal body rod protein FlgB [Bdellovibrionales bacterium]